MKSRFCQTSAPKIAGSVPRRHTGADFASTPHITRDCSRSENSHFWGPPWSWDTHIPHLSSGRKTRSENTTSPIHRIAALGHPLAEFATPYLAHPANPPNPSPEQLIIRSDSGGQKRDDYRNEVPSKISVLEECHASVHGYSDGHAVVSSGIRKIGVGYVIRAGKRTLSSESFGIGPRANIYNAEMLGILLAFLRAKKIAESQGNCNIHIFCDNQSAIKVIADLSRHPCQFASRSFIANVQTFLSGHPNRKVYVTWVPRHNGISGNKVADRLANQGANVPPTPIFNRATTWIGEHSTLTAVRSWRKSRQDHTNARINSNYYIPHLPALKLHLIFNDSRLGRDIECRLARFLTGHGHYGEYHAQFHHDVDPRCACREWEETITHLTTSCPATAGQRELLSEFSIGVSRPLLFGSHPGLEAVAKFIAKTGIGRRQGGPPATAQNF
ncbi:RNase H domain-containing protein [Rhizoctonia solani]|uniref:ribonuclease H n=1 Tax=Rhizoctonia solani TaxID=456999 RepID=A0A8H8P7I1_9AGAM|nr:RNase H domain-containing protein [Rhizoctonia solani]QRW26615.1 RNase H domain-containing protein [Rhizoctonia solani]